jgi:ferredoxin-NADP reductase
VRREPDGRGGSEYAHDRLSVGDGVALTGPRNNFGLVNAPRYLFIAGGIGITPFLPMIREVSRRERLWRLVYLGRSEGTMPYLGALRDDYGDAVTVWASSQRGRYDLAALLDSTPPGTAVYCCGPELLIAAVETLGAARGHSVHVERFAPRPHRRPEPDEVLRAAHDAPSTLDSSTFEVVMADSGRTLTVAPDESVLDAVNRAGANVPSTCREGTCGTCEVRVLAGTPDHRDSVLSPEDRAANEYMMTCVSRSLMPSLTLDL